MEDVVGDDTARTGSRSSRSKGKDRQDSTVASFWLPLLRSACSARLFVNNETTNSPLTVRVCRSAAKEVGLSKDDQADLLETVESR